MNKRELNSTHCPICGKKMTIIREDINLFVQTDLSKCLGCKIEYSGLFGYKTFDESIANKCSNLGYEVYKQDADYGGGWTIRD